MTRAGFKLFVLICVAILVTGCASDQEKTKKFLDQGQSAYDSGQYGEAVIQVKNAIKLSPRSIAAHKLLAKVYLKQGDARQTFNTLLKLEQLDPNDLDNTARVASFYLLGRQPDEAKKRVDQVLAKNPDHVQALFLRAGLLSADAQNLDQIKTVYTRILDIDPKQARAHLALARIAGSERLFEDAQTHLLKAQKIDPGNMNIQKTLFDFYMSRQQPEKGLALLKDLAAQQPDKADPHIFLGNFYLGQGNADKAEAEYKLAIEKDTTNISAYMRLARVLNAKGDADAAEGYIQKAMAQEPDNFTIQNAYAEFHFSRNDLTKAREMVDGILAKRPDFMPAKVLSGRLMIRERKYDQAIQLFTDLIREEPDSPAYHFLLGSALFEKGKLTQAKAALANAIEKAPNHIQARVILANIHFRQQDYDLAQDNLTRVLARAPDNYQANLILGNIQMAKRENNAARKTFDRLIAIDPANPSAYYRLGILDRAEKKYAMAETHLKKALEFNPTLMDVFSALVSVYAIQEEYDKALQTIDSHLSAHSDHGAVAAVLMNLKGTILLSKDDMAGGEAAFKDAVEQNPRYVSPYLTLAKLYGAQKDWTAAEKIYQDLIEHRPDQALAHGLLGSLYERDGKQDLAETQYLKALDIDPDHIPALNNLAYLYAQQDRDLTKALELARRAKERVGQVPAIMDTLGWVYYKKQLFDSAAAEFESCTKINPQNPIFHYHLGLSYHHLGKTEKAKASFNKALSLNKDFDGADDARAILDKM